MGYSDQPKKGNTMSKKIIAVLIALVMVACSSALVIADELPAAVETEATITELGVLEDTAVEAESVVKDEGFSEISDSDKQYIDGVAEVADESVEKVEKQKLSKKKAALKKAEAKKKAKQKKAKYKKGLAAYIRKTNKKISKSKSLKLAGIFIEKGEKYNLEPEVLMAMAVRESRFNTGSHSSVYKGMMQTSGALARHYGYKSSQLFDPEVSVDVAARYLKSLKSKFKTYPKAICGYCYGGGAVSRGNYNIAVGNKVMKTRNNIKDYLEKNNYI